jgi:hypothetical protein
VVNYSDKSKESTNKNKLRSIDGWNLSTFSGGDLGCKNALAWLEKELDNCTA